MPRNVTVFLNCIIKRPLDASLCDQITLLLFLLETVESPTWSQVFGVPFVCIYLILSSTEPTAKSSSANWLITTPVPYEISGKSFINIEKSREDTTVPWGVPHVKVLVSENEPAT